MVLPGITLRFKHLVPGLVFESQASSCNGSLGPQVASQFSVPAKSAGQYLDGKAHAYAKAGQVLQRCSIFLALGLPNQDIFFCLHQEQLAAERVNWTALPQ